MTPPPGSLSNGLFGREFRGSKIGFRRSGYHKTTRRFALVFEQWLWPALPVPVPVHAEDCTVGGRVFLQTVPVGARTSGTSSGPSGVPSFGSFIMATYRPTVAGVCPLSDGSRGTWHTRMSVHTSLSTQGGRKTMHHTTDLELWCLASALLWLTGWRVHLCSGLGGLSRMVAAPLSFVRPTLVLSTVPSLSSTTLRPGSTALQGSLRWASGRGAPCAHNHDHPGHARQTPREWWATRCQISWACESMI